MLRHHAAAAVAIGLAGLGGSCATNRAASPRETPIDSVMPAPEENAMHATARPSSDDAAAAHERWHVERLERLEAPEGWLTLVGLDFLDQGVSVAGRGEAATLRYAGCASERIGRFELAGETVRFLAEPGAEVTIERGVAGEPLTADDAGPPSVVRSGSVSFTLVRRNGRLALRVRDSESPVRTAFPGIACFPFDATRVVEASVELAEPDRRIAITNVTGFQESQPLAATLRFELDGEPHALLATPAGEGRLFVVFGDETNGRETYGGGRFLEVPAPIGGRTTIDFNRAYNPPCAFTAFATCPMPPAENRLPVRIEAGERAVVRAAAP